METDVSPARIVVAGSLTRASVPLALQRAADALLLLASPRRTQLLNFKLFEYLAAGRPILALAAGTEAGRVVDGAGRRGGAGRRRGGDRRGAAPGRRRRAAAARTASARQAYSYPPPPSAWPRSPKARWRRPAPAARPYP